MCLFLLFTKAIYTIIGKGNAKAFLKALSYLKIYGEGSNLFSSHFIFPNSSQTSFIKKEKKF